MGPQTLSLPSVELEGGRTLRDVDVAFETFGSLGPDGDNAVLVCHALSGDAHVAAGPDSDGTVRPG